jgi:DNA topoisomerase-1
MSPKRMVFHEITARAIQEALENPRDLDLKMVDAQETRRKIDRLYGYEVSPVLWKKVQPGLSAGRVQSIATRLVVDRERERMAFRAAGWWDIEGTFGAADEHFAATLHAVDGTPLATGKDFERSGEMKGAREVLLLDEAAARSLATSLAGADFTVTSVERKPVTRKPRPPFITSTLQQECGRKLRMSARQAMQAAQRLYEGGHITYMRTDSTTLSSDALSAARSVIRERFGAEYLPDAPRLYDRKVKNAQEAHEAIRPAGETFRDPQEVAREVTPGEARVYELIYQRTVASQMTDARLEQTTVLLGAMASDSRATEFRATGTVTVFPGFRAVYEESTDDGSGDEERRLPRLEDGANVTAVSLEPTGHETSPPARFTEASLVKRLEELGVGRPSTYASIMSTVVDRGYVWKKGSAMVPTWTAFAVTQLLERHFAELVDYQFTARMEDDLDDIANGEQEAVPVLEEFYRGRMPDWAGLHKLVTEHIDEIDAADINSFPIGVDEQGLGVVAKPGRYGPYVKRGDDTASIPDDLAPDELTIDKALELLSMPREGRQLGTDPESGLPVFAKNGRYGPYVQLGDPDELPEDEKPKMASLFQTMTLERITLHEALELLALPRVVGAHPESGEQIEALNGRYGPYLRMGKETRSIETEEKIFTVTLEEAVRILAEPKRRRGQQGQPVLKELGQDTITGKDVVVKDGRFGPYVTDGETNASLRKGDAVETITVERASELLEERRQNPPKKRAKKRGAKKGAAKKGSGAKRKAKKRSAPKRDDG